MSVLRRFVSCNRVESFSRLHAAFAALSVHRRPIPAVAQFPLIRQFSCTLSPRIRSDVFERRADAVVAEDAAADEAKSKDVDAVGAASAGPDPKDRSRKIPLEMSMRYLESDAYRQAYGNEPVWKPYRRNFKGQFAPKKTRRTCIRNDKIATGNPCPICRDEYLVIDPLNIRLLEQFISTHTGEILEPTKTGVCRVQHRHLEVAILRAQNMGLISFDVPFRDYDYDEYKPKNV